MLGSFDALAPDFGAGKSSQNDALWVHFSELLPSHLSHWRHSDGPNPVVNDPFLGG